MSAEDQLLTSLRRRGIHGGGRALWSQEVGGMQYDFESFGDVKDGAGQTLEAFVDFATQDISSWYPGHRLADDFSDMLKMSVVDDARLTQPDWVAVHFERILYLLDDDDISLMPRFGVWILSPKDDNVPGASEGFANVEGLGGSQSAIWKSTVICSDAWGTFAPRSTHLFVERA